MLQQTQAARVAPAYRAFLRRFPSVASLAGASPGSVLRAWAGLGYNRRAVALHRAARTVVREHGGRVPSDPDVLCGLPGIGPYTAAAVASMAFGIPVAAIDTNVSRVVRRAVLGRDDAPPADIAGSASDWLDAGDPGGWNQALMDLGREVCRPAPRCDACPLSRTCAFRRSRAPVAPPASPRQPAFDGSSRQLRGAIVRALRDRGSASLARLSRDTGRPLGSVADAVAAMSAEGILRAGPAALRGEPGGRARL
jgi:A/G-specific adenine glycosylase